MKLIMTALGVVVLPALAMADGGHPEAGSLHPLAHLVYFTLPVLLAGASLYVTRALRQRQRKARHR